MGGEVERGGDLAIGGAPCDEVEDLLLARGERAGVAVAAGGKTVSPSLTVRTACAMSSAGQSLGMKPEAPAALAEPGEILPAPEIRSTRVLGERLRNCSQISGPDSEPMNRSTNATCGS